MEELLASTLREISNGLLSPSVLKMSIDPTEGQALPPLFACCLKRFIFESAIISVVVEDGDPQKRGMPLKSNLGSNGFGRAEMAHQVDVFVT
jgi:hypothetical protein